MTYVALYRKYRSQSFQELMGQEAVTRTLQNALRSGRIAHAYLFYGARGCGKTSTARLVARALNCVAQDGPTPDPCGTCRLCVSIREGSCMDVVEIDAASETGVDNVREKIIENVQYAPVEARYKVYIIDEVHDLSAKAFDALLKTLEEPPAHVVFILATTELHKVPITIRSRCQSYFFKRGTVQDLSAAIQRVVTAEGYTADPEAILSLARSAEGSWRDALSLLEQVLAYADGHITAEIVHRAIGTVGIETLMRVTETLASGRWDAILAVADELISTGTDVRYLLTALSNHLRDLMLIASGATQTAMQELGPERYALLRPQAAHFDPRTLLTMSAVLSSAERDVRYTNQHRWLLESTLLRLLPENLPLCATPAEPYRRPPERAATGPEPVSATPTVIPKPPVSGHQTPPEAPEAAAESSDATEPEPPPAQSGQAPVDSVSGSPPPSSPVEPVSSGDSRFAEPVTLEVVQRSWERILQIAGKRSPKGVAFLRHASPVALEGNTIVLAFVNQFSCERIQSKGRQFVEEAINAGLHTEGYRIRCVPAETVGTPPASASNTSAQPAPDNTPSVGVLLDAPPAPPAARRIADFDTATPPHSAPPSEVRATGESPSQETESTLLETALDLFGGEVIATEEIPSS
ncbi:MAG: DNA polymerase III subunit gamma/tau [Chthonomonadaceae bacterium]|nr:DNA polymerase III subunit gamma/tau [Chthonomonadaceae bacterium]